jgi:hypothetical protein
VASVAKLTEEDDAGSHILPTRDRGRGSLQIQEELGNNSTANLYARLPDAHLTAVLPA